MSEIKNTIVKEDDVRPARLDGTCFYCRQVVGEPHTDRCIIPHKAVRVRVNVEYELDMPANWDDKMILFYLNDGTRCKDHIIEEIQNLVSGDYEDESRSGCLCFIAEYKLVDDGDLTH